MVAIHPPPPSNSPNPIFHFLNPGSRIIRIYDPTSYGTQALTFRKYGPLRRFDHHSGVASAGGVITPCPDPMRGIYYAGLTLSCCIVEIFGDTGVVDIQSQKVAYVEMVRPVKLLELRDNGAMRAGTVAGISGTSDTELTQAWSRHFYSSPDYLEIDGLIYANAHNGEAAIALYERAADALSCPVSQTIALSHPGLRPQILKIAEDHNLIVVP